MFTKEIALNAHWDEVSLNIVFTYNANLRHPGNPKSESVRCASKLTRRHYIIPIQSNVWSDLTTIYDRLVPNGCAETVECVWVCGVIGRPVCLSRQSTCEWKFCGRVLRIYTTATETWWRVMHMCVYGGGADCVPLVECESARHTAHTFIYNVLCAG